MSSLLYQPLFGIFRQVHIMVKLLLKITMQNVLEHHFLKVVLVKLVEPEHMVKKKSNMQCCKLLRYVLVAVAIEKKWRISKG